MMTNPLRWATVGGAQIVEPPDAKKTQGHNAGEPTAAEFMNWWMNQVGEIIVSPGALHGLTLSNGADSDHDIDIAIGFAADSESDVRLDLTSVLTKQIDNPTGGVWEYVAITIGISIIAEASCVCRNITVRISVRLRAPKEAGLYANL